MSKFTKITDNIRELVIPISKSKDLRWLNISNARKKEISFLRKHFPFSLNHLETSSIQARAIRPTIEKGSGYLFMILHFPVIRHESVLAGEIEFFIGKDYIVTLHDNISGLNNFFNYFKKADEDMLTTKDPSPPLLLFEIIERLQIECYTLLDSISQKAETIEQLIFAKESKKAVSQILSLRRDIVNTRKIMQNHTNIIKQLLDREIGLVTKKYHEEIFTRLLEKSKRIWENLENQKDIVEILNSTNESFLNYQISDIMKTLTIFSVIVFPLNLLAAIFGMNIVGGMPFMSAGNGFWIIIASMLTGSLCMLFFFERKRWL